MKSYSKLSLCWAVYLMLLGTSLGQDSKNVIDLDRVADLLKFPRSELVITDYLDQEKFIYTKKLPPRISVADCLPLIPSRFTNPIGLPRKHRMHFCPLLSRFQSRMPISRLKSKRSLKN